MKEPCGNCYDTHRRETAREYICVRCGDPARECVRCVEIHTEMVSELGPRTPIDTCARCCLEHEIAMDAQPRETKNS